MPGNNQQQVVQASRRKSQVAAAVEKSWQLLPGRKETPPSQETHPPVAGKHWQHLQGKSRRVPRHTLVGTPTQPTKLQPKGCPDQWWPTPWRWETTETSNHIRSPAFTYPVVGFDLFPFLTEFKRRHTNMTYSQMARLTSWNWTLCNKRWSFHKMTSLFRWRRRSFQAGWLTHRRRRSWWQRRWKPTRCSSSFSWPET